MRSSCALGLPLVVVGFGFVVGCGARSGLEIPEAESGDGDGGVDVPDAPSGRFPDAADAADADAAPDADDALCDFGTVVSDVFGNVVDFAGGAALPKGRYRLTYVDGCMKYSTGQGWAVNAYAPGTGTDSYWLVDGNHDDVLVPPGTVGFTVGGGGYANFDDCVAANLQLPPIDFDFAGGVLGVWLHDAPYSDNEAGENGRNPTWRLTCAE